MSEPVNTDYAMSARDASELKGVVLLPFEIRREILDNYRKTRGADALVDLFAHFIGMANAVVKNSYESVFLLGIIEGNMHPHQAEKINVPSLFGALQGIELAAQVDQRKTCDGCAFRLGTLANQSPSTTSDAIWCNVGDEELFMCHEHLDEQGEPIVPCGGHEQVRRHQHSPERV